MKRLFQFSLVLLLTACGQFPINPGDPINTGGPINAGNTVTVDGNLITYAERGKGKPTIVFESGLGDGLETWNSIIGDVSKSAHTFTYSRPGYAPGPRKMEIGGERTARESAKLLKMLLDRKAVPAPYVLVGHSIGGLYVLEFARSYPDLVAGLILVDGRVPGFTRACKKADVGLCSPPAIMAAMAPPHISAEIRGIKPSEAAAPTPADIGSLPTTLIVASKPPPGVSKKVQPVWIDSQASYSNALARGRLVMANGSGHYIHKDSPELVIREIRRMIQQLDLSR